ncbi:MAG: GTP cyclohydrolase I, partial [Chloroflexi bacterium]|nr:GTP cyclohydrolase I [Chloroflexota bacterium]
MENVRAGIDREGIAQAVRRILEAVREDPRREGLRETPRRVAEMYAELLSGVEKDPRAELAVSVDEGHREMV